MEFFCLTDEGSFMKKKRSIKQIYIVVIVILLTTTGCSLPFKPVNIDPVTGKFPASVEVQSKHIKTFKPLAGVKEARFVYLRADSYSHEALFYDFMKDGLAKVGFANVYNRNELSQITIRSGLSQYVTNLSDPISLHNLASSLGPFLILECAVFPIADAVFRFDVQLIEPITGNTYLEVSRIRTNWVDMDREINYPILNVIKRWHDESIELPYKKPDEELDSKELF